MGESLADDIEEAEIIVLLFGEIEVPRLEREIVERVQAAEGVLPNGFLGGGAGVPEAVGQGTAERIASGGVGKAGGPRIDRLNWLVTFVRLLPT